MSERELGDTRRLEMLAKMYMEGVSMHGAKVVSVETLLDILLLLHDECGRMCNHMRPDRMISDFVGALRPAVDLVKRTRLTREDFEILKVIGRGAFGEVAVVRLRGLGKVYAMKTLNKWEMLKRADTACFREERDVLVHGDSNWITRLHYAFQDENYLYLIMDYYSGGDMLTLLSKFEDSLPEPMAQFYLAEIILAIDSVHRLGYTHRDVKPDNLLLDTRGHLVLADFGSCLKLNENGLVTSKVTVGTPDYISPEVLLAMEDSSKAYGPECDWWSVGVCAYEFLFGETPFYAESLLTTYSQIMGHKSFFKMPDPSESKNVSAPARDLISRLVCDPDQRLGRGGLRDFIDHPFFAGIDWENIRNMEAPYVPEVHSATDTSNFDIEENNFKEIKTEPPPSHSAFKGYHLPFVGFTFSENSPLSDVGKLSSSRTAIEDGDKEVQSRSSPPRAAPVVDKQKNDNASTIDQQELVELTERCSKLEASNAQLREQLNESTKDQRIELARAEQLAEKLQARQSELEAELASARHAAQSDADSAAANLAKERRRREAAELRLAALEGQVAVAAAAPSPAQLDQANATIAELRSELSATSAKLAESEADRQAQARTLAEENRRLASQLATAEAREESLAKWEAQIEDLTEWIRDEKVTKDRLLMFTNKMLEDLEGVRAQTMAAAANGFGGGLAGGPDSTWRRKAQEKKDKMQISELELTLKSERTAKEQLYSELNETKEKMVSYHDRYHQTVRLNGELMEQLRELKKELQLSNTLSDLPTMNRSLSRSIEERSVSPTPPERSESLKGQTSASYRPRQGSATGSRSNSSGPVVVAKTAIAEAHDFIIKSFDTPAKCHVCTSVMLGLFFQGMQCSKCQCSCHLGCRQSVQLGCPYPLKSAVPYAITNDTGAGTVKDGAVRLPKPGGIRKGWVRHWLSLSDLKLVFFEFSEKGTPLINAARVIDLRQPQVSVQPVSEDEVYHAKVRDQKCIFRIGYQEAIGANESASILVLVETPEEAKKWLACVQNVQKFIAEHNLAVTSWPVECMEALSGQASQLKSCNSAALLDPDRLLLGTDDGLFVADMQRDTLTRVGDKKRVQWVQVLYEVQLVLAVVGKQRQLKLYPLVLCEGKQTEGYAVQDCKGLVADVVCGRCSADDKFYAFALSRRQIWGLEITSAKSRHTRVFERTLPESSQASYTTCQLIECQGDTALCLAGPQTLLLLTLRGEPLCTPPEEHQKLLPSAEPRLIVQVAKSEQQQSSPSSTTDPADCELLLCYDHCGIYVTSRQCQRTRPREVLWPAKAAGFSCLTEGKQQQQLLTVCTDAGAFVYSVGTGQWLQTLAIRRVRSLGRQLSLLLGAEAMNVYHAYAGGEQPSLKPPAATGPTKPQSKKFSIVKQMTADHVSVRSSRMISGPMDFKHVQHMGPDVSNVRLIDLQPEGASGSDQSEQLSRARSILVEKSRQTVLRSTSDLHSSQGSLNQASGSAGATAAGASGFGNFSVGRKP
ncbi:hypothetical protein BOX15_Mlig002375g1 [Macrostomum lignano]|uniref:non-specific serine/threonine protein kinase n=1 Tax=Macrostomum lignano TaxID=282301 RepID=A0A267DRM3_9PLAT|nr:hypothetical protein BOX15_Mlig002375g1 [Macrostomum lignano]